ncbi:MAG: hypothetical protein IPN75_06210 [Dechloromonas sp.]|uniref:Uncharacterized protein n=1 Tax=Candidatus Dechloromonas phosphorivorans TaxID=2899244 RepID=A0A9D7QMK1_9RHOO|nr:hypothetical protein [Candidatus Dechloromonas phosphorivorans]
MRGQGNIGTAINVAGNNLLTNNGLISADVSGGTLNITAPASGGGSSIVNNNILEARNGGTLVISTNVNNAAGQINAQNGSQVLQNSVTITHGTLGSNGTGVIAASAGLTSCGVRPWRPDSHRTGHDQRQPSRPDQHAKGM